MNGWNPWSLGMQQMQQMINSRKGTAVKAECNVIQIYDENEANIAEAQFRRIWSALLCGCEGCLQHAVHIAQQEGRETTSLARPSWDTYFMRIAHDVATRATCDRKHVGAVIVDDRNRIVSTGYNGAPAGMPHCSGPEGVGHELKMIEGRKSCVRTLHAESNALDDAGRRAFGGTLYVTVTPCYPCMQRLVNAGIRRVVYGEWYESQNTHLVVAFAQQAGVDLVGFLKAEL